MIKEVLRANNSYFREQYYRHKELFDGFKNILLNKGSLIAPPKYDSRGMLIFEDPVKEKVRQISLSLIREPKAEERKALKDRGWTFVSSQIKSFSLIPDGTIVDFQSFDSLLRKNGYGPLITVAVNTRQTIRPKGFWNLNYSQWLVLEKQRTFLEKKLRSQKDSMIPALVYISSNISFTGEKIPAEFSLRCPNEVYLCQTGNGQSDLGSRVFPRNFFVEYDVGYGDNTNIEAFPAIVFKNILLTLKK